MLRKFGIAGSLLVLILGSVFISHVKADPSFSYTKYSYTAQTAPIASTTLFTPSSDGDYRVTAYADVSGSAEGQARINTFIGWTDDYRSHPFSQSAYPGENLVYPIDMVIHCVSGQPVTFYTEVKDSSNGAVLSGWNHTYNVYVTVIGN